VEEHQKKTAAFNFCGSGPSTRAHCSLIRPSSELAKDKDTHTHTRRVHLCPLYVAHIWIPFKVISIFSLFLFLVCSLEDRDSLSSH